ncbi:MAG: hypothetical protein WCT54_04730 [Patescibacteria group bacterium]|jgi:hypothetical protein
MEKAHLYFNVVISLFFGGLAAMLWTYHAPMTNAGCIAFTIGAMFVLAMGVVEYRQNVRPQLQLERVRRRQ